MVITLQAGQSLHHQGLSLNSIVPWLVPVPLMKQCETVTVASNLISKIQGFGIICAGLKTKDNGKKIATQPCYHFKISGLISSEARPYVVEGLASHCRLALTLHEKNEFQAHVL